MQLNDIANRLFSGEIDNQQAAVELDELSARMKRLSAFGIQTQGPGKHRASKPLFNHKKVSAKKSSRGDGLTNHERVILGRARRMGITIEEYCRRFSVRLSPSPRVGFRRKQ